MNIKKMIVVFCLGLLFAKSGAIKASGADLEGGITGKQLRNGLGALAASLGSVVSHRVMSSTESLCLEAFAGTSSVVAAFCAIGRSPDFLHCLNNMNLLGLLPPNSKQKVLINGALVSGVVAGALAVSNRALGTSISCWTGPAVVAALVAAGTIKRGS